MMTFNLSHDLLMYNTANILPREDLDARGQYYLSRQEFTAVSLVVCMINHVESRPDPSFSDTVTPD